ncbi:glycoside hydrolase family 13 protein [Anaerosporobacter faecicola]|uniref:glycoside hydrolase family 13 protein n=1 Tax=Anaerosporobacter faecicola TaxID=2718714 RepID=UPI00143C3C8F|nr:alpha-glucosidase [Anaerosporobacter faecicola]
MSKVWWKESVVYQIYPRSFMDSNGDGIGDLNGITSKLDYLKELGVDVLWISPVYKSPGADNGYDISDYQDILDEFGTMEDFDRLLEQAHQRGLKIVMDLVLNHTSNEHPWFIESRSTVNNPYRNYYIWRKGQKGSEPNNWGAMFGGSAWEYDTATDMYYLHCFSKEQPDLNWEEARVRKSLYDMMTWWCEKGVDGFRFDVISMISKVQTFPDGKKDGGLYGNGWPYIMNGPKVHDYIQEMNREVLSKYDIMTVGEAAGVTLTEAKKYANTNGKELNMVFQFEHMCIDEEKYGKWTTKRYNLLDLKRVLSKWQTGLEGKAWNSLFFGNHDQPRSVSRFGDDRPEYRERSAKMLATCMHMMQGTPYVYQGEELGMTNFPFEDLTQCRDIETLHYYAELTENGIYSNDQMMDCIRARGRDNARTPMQWDTTMNAGFSTGTPWIAVNPNYKEINAKEQLERTDSLFYYYQQLIRLRHMNKIMVYGHYKLLLPNHKDIFAYKRNYYGKEWTILCNFSEQEVTCKYANLTGKKLIISNYEEHKKGILQPYEALVYQE